MWDVFPYPTDIVPLCMEDPEAAVQNTQVICFKATPREGQVGFRAWSGLAGRQDGLMVT